jgi:hypothetical protein
MEASGRDRGGKSVGEELGYEVVRLLAVGDSSKGAILAF